MRARIAAFLLLLCLPPAGAFADGTYQSLPFSQNWTNIGLITVSDDWSGVPGVLGYRGDHASLGTGIDPRTITFDDAPANTGVAGSPVLDVNANQTDPVVFNTGGVAEFHLGDPVVALNGSGTADTPYLVVHINSTGARNIVVSCLVRDIEGGAGVDNAVSPIAIQFRTAAGTSWTNVPLGYLTDASVGPGAITQTAVRVLLPPAANNSPNLQVRWITTNAVGNDEWIGIDDIVIVATPPAATNVLYGTQGNAGDQLVTINRLTGVGTLIGSTGHSLSGLAVSPSGVLYGSTPGGNSQLFLVDPTTAASTLIGDLGYIVGDGLAFDAAGNLFSLGYPAPVPQATLYQIDPTTATSTPVGSTGENLNGMAFDPISGVLYASTGGFSPVVPDAIYTIDPTTAAITLVGTTGFGGSTPDIAFDVFGNLYGVKGGGGGASSLIKIDKSTGSGTLVGPVGFNGISGMGSQAYFGRAPKGGYYGTQGGSGDAFIRVDVTTGAGTLIAHTGLNLSGLAVGPTGLVYATTGNDFVASDLYLLDPVTGATVLLGSTGVLYMDAIAFDLNGAFWGYGDAGPDQLYRIDPETGATTVVGPSGAAVSGLAVDPGDGTLYGSNGGGSADAIYIVDRSNGSVTPIGPTGLGGATPDLLFSVFGTLYGTKGGGPNPSTLIRINKSTGAGVAVGAGLGFTGVSGLASRTLANARPGVLYGSTGSTNDALITIDPQTGAGTLVGHTGLPGMPGLAIDSFGQLYCTLRSSGDLFRLDAENGQAFLVGSTGVDFTDGIAFDVNDLFYSLGAAGPENLYSLDPLTAVPTFIGATGEQLAGMSFDPTNNALYASSGGAGAAIPDAIYRVNVLNGTIVLVGTTGLGGAIEDIQFGGNGQLYGVKKVAGLSNLILIDKANGSATVVGPVGFEPVSGLAAIPGRPLLDTPAPAKSWGVALLPVTPNPVVDGTLLRFTLAREGEARLEVFNVLGQRVSRLVDGRLPAGEHSAAFAARDLPPGLYYARLSSAGAHAVQKMMILR